MGIYNCLQSTVCHAVLTNELVISVSRAAYWKFNGCIGVAAKMC